MATWPATLPAPLLSGYSVSPREQVARTEMDGGNTRARRRTTARIDMVTATWSLTDTEMATFRAWWDGATDAAGGASWFTITLRAGYGGTESVDARFAGPWQAEEITPRKWRVSATLEVRPSA